MRYLKTLMATAALLASVTTLNAQDDKGGKKKGGFQLPPMIHK